MPPLPPTADVLNALQHAVLPAAGGAAFVCCLFLVMGRWAGALGSGVGVLVGFAAANYTFVALAWDKTDRVLPWKPEPDAPSWHWLPKVGLVLVIIGLVSRWIGMIAAHYLPEKRWWGANLLVWAPRVAAVLVVSNWLVSEKYAAEHGWLFAALAAAMLLEWVILDGLARTKASAQVVACLSAVLVLAGAVMLYAHSARFMEAGVMLGFALLGVAAACGAVKADASGAIPAVVGLLPGLMLTGRFTTDSKVPVESFWLLALAPLALAPFLVPALCRKHGWVVRIIRVVLILAPAIAGVVLAAQHEQLVFEEW